jgi:ADP-L-glycero-D-manno-heptose 6-epimerase
MRYIDDTLAGKTILITGGAGFIGSNLAFYFQNNHPEAHVVVFDSFRNEETFSNGNLKSFGHFKNLVGFTGDIISGDITKKEDLKRLKNLYKFDYVFHQAAISDTTALEQDVMIKTNVNAFVDLLEMAVEHDANMIYASSGATYGNVSSPQTVGKENPENVYGFSKLMMDHMAKPYMHHKNISVVGLRYFNVYGPREYYKNKTASMVIQLGHQILSGKAPRLFYGSDKILRDFIYVEDIIQANIKAMNPKKNGVYNIGTGMPRSFQDIADILQRELGTSLGTDYFANPYKAYQEHTQADIETTRQQLAFEPRFTLEAGIQAYIPEIRALYEQVYG